MSSDWDKKVYADRKDKGICVCCGENPKSKTSLKCDSCSQKAKTARDRKKNKGICKCGKPVVQGKTMCQEHLDYRKSYYKNVLKKRSEDGLCKCGAERSEGKHTCARCLEKQKLSKQRVKDMVFENYGGYKCNCCGETEKVFLTIDHVNGGGSSHRREMNGTHTYHWLKKNNFPDGYQVLCFNCNHAKRFGVCPHQLKNGG